MPRRDLRKEDLGMSERTVLWRSLGIAAISLALVGGVASPGLATNGAQATDATEPSSDPVDAGLINEQAEDALPDVIDEWPEISLGGCSMSSSGVGRSGLFVTGSATVTCSGAQRVAAIQVCIQRRTLDRWLMLSESCRGAAATGGSASATASTLCTPGTWKYRLYVIGEVTGSTITIFANKDGATRIACPVAGEEERP